jgi:hypothetical protein
MLESQEIQYRNQRAAEGALKAPDVLAQNRVAASAARQDKRDAAARLVGHSAGVSLGNPLGIGTDAIYSTLPNNAGKITLSRLTVVGLSP